MSERMMRQVKLQQGNRIMNTWTDDDPKLKNSVDISLKDVDGRWKVLEIYDVVLPISQLDKQRNFDNNNYDHHKGLGL